MPRKYDCIVRFYASWFADLTNESKGFSNEEIGQIFLKIGEAQIKCQPEIINELPITIKRGLQMATLEEQIQRLIERSARCKERGSIGGQVTASRYQTGNREAAAEREKRLAVERQLEESRNERHKKYQEHREWVRHELAKEMGIEVQHLSKNSPSWTQLRKVWEKDQRAGSLAFADWLIYLKVLNPEDAKKVYKNLLQTNANETKQEEKQCTKKQEF